MPTTEERLAALEKQMAAWIAQQPTNYYTHKYSGEEIDDAVGKIRSGAGDGAVRYDQAQTLTPAQQSQAQANIGTTWPCNPNLLDNWHFQIWQRYSNGSYSGVPNGSYVADRWIITSSNGDITSNLTAVTPYGGIKNATGPNCRITQRLENAAQFNGMTLTLSVLKNTGLYTATKVANGWNDTTDIFGGFSSKTAWLNAGETILAIKLELGPTQTLAHREGDRWVLNEVPKFGRDLAEGQRYFWRFSPPQYVAGAIAFGFDKNTARAMIYLPEQMRTSPTLNLNASAGLFLTGASGDIFDVTVSGVWTAANAVCVDFKKDGAFEVNAPYFVRGDTSAYIDISADL